MVKGALIGRVVNIAKNSIVVPYNTCTDRIISKYGRLVGGTPADNKK